MSESFAVRVPLLNTNEPEARVVALHVDEGEHVAAGDALCTLETTKSTADVVAEREGVVVGLRAEVGSTLHAGQCLCWLAPEEGWEPPEPAAMQPSEEDAFPDDLRITEPAMALVRDQKLDLGKLPIGPLVTKAIVLQVLAANRVSELDLPSGPFDPQALVIYGGGGHGKSLIDLLRALGTYELIGVIDDGMPPGAEVMGLPVLGGSETLPVLAERGLRMVVNAVGGVGDIMSRVGVYERIKETGFTCPTVFHPTAVVEPSAHTEEGVQVFPNAYIGSEVKIGFGAIINTGAVVSHDCRLDDYTNIAPGALLAGGVTVGARVLIGMGVTIHLNVEVGSGAKVGNSAVVKTDVPPGAIVRAGSIWPD